jgi:hypothetical protein
VNFYTYYRIRTSHPIVNDREEILIIAIRSRKTRHAKKREERFMKSLHGVHVTQSRARNALRTRPITRELRKLQKKIEHKLGVLVYEIVIEYCDKSRQRFQFPHSPRRH